MVINELAVGPLGGGEVAGRRADAGAVRGGRPVILTNCRTGEGLDDVVARLAHDVLMAE